MILSVPDLLFLDCVLEQDVNYNGENLLNKATKTHELCANLCADTILCAFWSWDSTGKMCWIKKSGAGREDKVGFLSGTPQCGEGEQCKKNLAKIKL